MTTNARHLGVYQVFNLSPTYGLEGEAGGKGGGWGTNP